MKRIALIAAILVGTLVAVWAGGMLFVAPMMADKAIRTRIIKVQEKTGWQIDYKELETSGLGVAIDDITISDESGVFLRLKSVRAGIDIASAMGGEKRLSSLDVDGVEFTIHVDKEGQVHPLHGLLNRPKTGGTGHGQGRSLAERLGQLPSVHASNIIITVEVEPGGPAPPINTIRIPEASMSSDDTGFLFQGAAELTSIPDQAIQVPKNVTGRLILDRELVPRGGELTFDTPLRVTGLSPLPFLSFGLSGGEISEAGVLIAKDVEVNAQGTRLFEAERIGVSLQKIPKSLDELRIIEVSATNPILYMDYTAPGANVLNDIYLALRAPQANQVLIGARRFAQKRAEKLKLDPPDIEPNRPNGESSIARLEHFVKRWAPQVIRIEGAKIIGVDERSLTLDRKVRDIALENAYLTLEHELGPHRVVLKGGFDAMGDGAALGNALVDLDIDYSKMSVSGDITIDALDLSWAGQLLGPRVRNLVGGGTLRAKIKLQAQGKKAFGAVGMISVDDLTVTAPIVAEEALKGLTASYNFSAKYSALAAMPDAALLETPVYKTPKVAEGEPQPPAPPAPLGSLVFEAGKLRVNGVDASFRPAFFGFNAPKRLPARMDLHVDLPKTNVMSLFNAIPKAVQGPTAGTKMTGTLAWTLDVELPFYRASDMKWDSKPDLQDFELLDIPQEVDVRRLMKNMNVHITDSIEEKDDFERTINLAAARPVPAQWLVDNAGLTIEEIDERRRDRQWPKIPAGLDMAPSYVASPQFWLSNAAENLAAKRPWGDGDPLVGVNPENPLGRYVFVPLQYISHYLPLAVMTTEDNSFFKHDGFNMHALRASIERNISAGGFKRGASTIAMQMIKNVFLNRKKLLSRKIQEAFLVFLMESAVNIPKARIMEVYLNVIEFGPGIFGIHEASVYYFGKRPDELTLAEAAWFVSIIPGPKKYHFYYERGEISERWFARMKRYIQVMFNRERITQEELDTALASPPEFYKPADGEPMLRPKAPPSLWAPLDDLQNPFGPQGSPPPNALPQTGEKPGAPPTRATPDSRSTAWPPQ